MEELYGDGFQVARWGVIFVALLLKSVIGDLFDASRGDVKMELRLSDIVPLNVFK